MASVHDRIKERRSEIGMTLLQLADQVGVKEATAQRWESGAIKNIPYNRIVEIANVRPSWPRPALSAISGRKGRRCWGPLASTRTCT